MFGVRGGRPWVGTLPLSLLLVSLTAPDADAQWRGRSTRRAPAYPSARVVPAPPRPPDPLGTFYRTPYIFTRGNAPAGGGYSPLGAFGDATMSLYGPFSAF